MKKFLKKIGSFTKEEFVGTWRGFSKERIKPLTLILVVINVVCLLVSNIVAIKTFNLFSIGEGAKAFSVALPTAMVLFPVVLTVSDMLAELDYVWTRRSCHIGFILNLFMVLVFTICIYIPGFINGQPDQGTSGGMNNILGSTWFMLIASMISFYLGDLINDTVFKKMKEKDAIKNNKSLFNRCVLSTLLGQLIDSSTFIIFGMYLFPILFGVNHLPYIGAVYDITNNFEGGFGLWHGWAAVLSTIALQVITKTLYEIILSPVIIKLCRKGRELNNN